MIEQSWYTELLLYINHISDPFPFASAYVTMFVDAEVHNPISYLSLTISMNTPQSTLPACAETSW